MFSFPRQGGRRRRRRQGGRQQQQHHHHQHHRSSSSSTTTITAAAAASLIATSLAPGSGSTTRLEDGDRVGVRQARDSWQSGNRPYGNHVPLCPHGHAPTLPSQLLLPPHRISSSSSMCCVHSAIFFSNSMKTFFKKYLPIRSASSQFFQRYSGLCKLILCLPVSPQSLRGSLRLLGEALMLPTGWRPPPSCQIWLMKLSLNSSTNQLRTDFCPL